ncbi:MAG: hypothetical protein ABJN34_01915 [Litoreibacter sp.]|uniref:hypothetical protein n=1 Tax=Litoreibacter sp. TaxID=1969459 RepID=UPI0032996BDC
MSFEILNKLAFVVTALLCVILLFAPGIVYWLFGVEASETADFIARRTAMLFAGLSVLTFMTVDTESDELRQTVSLSMAVAMSGLAILGMFELLRGVAGIGMLVAVAAELFFAFYYLRFWRD